MEGTYAGVHAARGATRHRGARKQAAGTLRCASRFREMMCLDRLAETPVGISQSSPGCADQPEFPGLEDTGGQVHEVHFSHNVFTFMGLSHELRFFEVHSQVHEVHPAGSQSLVACLQSRERGNSSIRL
jgi:hypothetical protein